MEYLATKRALVLWSGGLDSRLAVALVRDQGIPLALLTLDHPYADRRAAVQAADALGMAVEVVDFTGRMVEIFEACTLPGNEPADLALVCHAEMIRMGLEHLEDLGCDFLVTGEVVDQRIPQQSREALVAPAVQGADQAHLVVRPLSAQRLPETTPEREGWIRREQCLGIEGPGRSEQEKLAQRMGIDPVTSPHDASCLANPAFLHRVRDLRVHEGLRGRRALTLLAMGRHFRLGPVTKLVIGQSIGENEFLARHAELYDLLLSMEDIAGPTGLLPVVATEDQIRTAASICARFSDVDEEGTAPVGVRSTRESRRLEVRPAPDEQIALWQV